MIKKLLFFFLIAFSFACNKTDQVGLGVAPESDKPGVRFNNSYRVGAYTQREDSLRTDEPAFNLLGTYVDPLFGKSEAAFASQFRLSTHNVNFGPSPTLDSLILSLSYVGYYGDVSSTNGIQNIKVYELTTAIDKGTNYYGNADFSSMYDPQELANISIQPRPTDNVLVNGVSQDPQLRINLSNTLGNKFINASGTGALANDEGLASLFKGLFVTALNASQTSGQGAILHFDLLNSDSKLTLYYKDSNGAPATYDFIINSDCARINLFKKDYSNAVFAGQLNQSSTDSSLVYIQSNGGTTVKIEFPFIQSLKDSGTIIINKAEVIFEADADAGAVLKPTDQLYLLPLDANGKVKIIADQLESSSFYGGFYDPVTHQYKFNIGKHLQQVIYGNETDYGWVLAAGNSASLCSRVVIKGKNNIKFNLTYTKF